MKDDIDLMIMRICQDNTYLLGLLPEIKEIIAAWKSDRKFYERVLTRAVSLPKGQLPDGEDYYCCMLNGNVKVFRK